MTEEDILTEAFKSVAKEADKALEDAIVYGQGFIGEDGKHIPFKQVVDGERYAVKVPLSAVVDAGVYSQINFGE